MTVLGSTLERKKRNGSPATCPGIAGRMAHELACASLKLTHWPTVWAVGGLLVVYAFTLDPLGYILATAIFVPASARALGSQSLVRDTAAGLAVAIVIYFFFTEVLEIRLPTAGILDQVL